MCILRGVNELNSCDIYIYIHSFIHSLVFSLRGRAGRNQSRYGSGTLHPGKVLGVVCHCFPPPLDVPTFAARCLYVRNDARDHSSERWNRGREICPVILPKFRLPHKFRDLLHAANLRLYFPSEGRCAEDFFALKIRRLRPGLNPRNWVRIYIYIRTLNIYIYIYIYVP